MKASPAVSRMSASTSLVLLLHSPIAPIPYYYRRRRRYCSPLLLRPPPSIITLVAIALAAPPYPSLDYKAEDYITALLIY